MERKEKGLLYRVGNPEIRKLQNHQLVLLADYNRMDLADWTSRRALLKELFASFGEDSCGGKDRCKLGRMFLPCGESCVCQFQSDHDG
ncbi:maltose acetyltransferase domain-containing protein [Faecalibaculum rodentium]|uniref:maltose acetyltransferase domain-containing protein n=1 Tax=Faecalibaculum rodentium TaxID=1702221 RepID=UPI0023F52C98|nr:maltose acetyltransferase domain-containing protein [Faecalibaculum rodentium]